MSYDLEFINCFYKFDKNKELAEMYSESKCGSYFKVEVGKDFGVTLDCSFSINRSGDNVCQVSGKSNLETANKYFKEWVKFIPYNLNIVEVIDEGI